MLKEFVQAVLEAKTAAEQRDCLYKYLVPSSGDGGRIISHSVNLLHHDTASDTYRVALGLYCCHKPANWVQVGKLELTIMGEDNYALLYLE